MGERMSLRENDDSTRGSIQHSSVILDFPNVAQALMLASSLVFNPSIYSEANLMPTQCSSFNRWCTNPSTTLAYTHYGKN